MFFHFLAQVSIKDNFAPANKFTSLADLVNLLSRGVAYGGGFMIIVAFVYSAYLYISAGGEAKNIEKTKTVLSYAIIGMMVIVASYWLTQIIAKLLGRNF